MSRVLLTRRQGFHKGTIAMVVVAACLAACICVVWWQDKRTEHIQVITSQPEKRVEDDIEMQATTETQTAESKI